MSDNPPEPPLIAVEAGTAPPRGTASNYPEPFASRMAGRTKRPLEDLFGLRNFGVNLTTLAPGAVSALHHRHSLQDEFIYVLAGEPNRTTRMTIDAYEGVDDPDLQLLPHFGTAAIDHSPLMLAARLKVVRRPMMKSVRDSTG